MPDRWYNWISNKISKGKTSSEKKENWLNRKLLADKKPYFMQYIYPAEKAKMNDYIKKNNEKCIMKFRITLDELLNKKNKTEDEKNFIYYYYQGIPLGIAPCTINKICWKIENIFKDRKYHTSDNFDYSILKSNAAYSPRLYTQIKKIYDTYRHDLSNYMQYAKSERIKSEERQIQKFIFKEKFKRQCLEHCPNEDILCNIVLDLCYSKSNCSKQFAWDICGDVFIQNLLKRNNYLISYPTLDENGDIEYSGLRFRMNTTNIKDMVEIETEDTQCPLY
ncbi:MAG: hypothetical protein HFI33_02715 [Lachnospiraceae bacterium]|nr:hypothetical protein [Lachnospiraceae bacterium]